MLSIFAHIHSDWHVFLVKCKIKNKLHNNTAYFIVIYWQVKSSIPECFFNQQKASEWSASEIL